MRIELRWSWIEDETASTWDATNCAYAFTDPESDEILFIDVAFAATVRDCCEAARHEELWKQLRAIGIENVGVLVGMPRAEPEAPVTHHLLDDVVHLLVIELEPIGNAAAASSQPGRTDLEVQCSGEWPYEESVFAAGS